jgi:hypothetical protein
VVGGVEVVFLYTDPAMTTRIFKKGGNAKKNAFESI